MLEPQKAACRACLLVQPWIYTVTVEPVCHITRLHIPKVQYAMGTSGLSIVYVNLKDVRTLEQNNQPDAANSRKIYCLIVQILLNMFRASQCPSSGARQTAVAGC
jgi:hypothetical protein